MDGGKGQMTAALDVLENELGLDVPLCGLAKDDKHKTSELLYGEPPVPIDLDRKSQEFYLVQRIQDEVHRFAISFHRQLRGKGAIQSELDSIPGVGKNADGFCSVILNLYRPLKKRTRLKLRSSVYPNRSRRRFSTI